MNKTKFSILLSVVFIAVLLLSAGCGGGSSNDPKKEGEKAAKEVCDCLKKIGYAAIECLDKLDDKYEKWEDNEAFEEAYLKALEKVCGDLPSKEGEKAAKEACDCLKKGFDFEDCERIDTKYVVWEENEAFEEAFLMAFEKNCSDIFND